MADGAKYQPSDCSIPSHPSLACPRTEVADSSYRHGKSGLGEKQFLLWWLELIEERESAHSCSEWKDRCGSSTHRNSHAESHHASAAVFVGNTLPHALQYTVLSRSTSGLRYAFLASNLLNHYSVSHEHIRGFVYPIRSILSTPCGSRLVVCCRIGWLSLETQRRG